MCRLFGQIATQPASARDLLVDSPVSLLHQSNVDKKRLQKDGWGIGWFENGRARVSKRPRAAFKEAALFAQTASTAVSSVVIGHLRAASNPRGLSRAKLITTDNTQPFTDQGWIFVHNGTLEIPLEVAAALGPLKRRLKSYNDSEVYFYQFLKFQKKFGSPLKAFKACIQETWAIWKACKSRYPEKTTPYTSINAIASNGTSLHALCHTVKRGPQTYGACHPKQPWSVMSITRRAGRFIIASEGVDNGHWTLVRPPEILSVHNVQGKLRAVRTRFTLQQLGLEPMQEASLS